MGRKRDPYSGQFEAQTYDVTVWDIVEGDVVKKLWSATEAELREVEEQYANEPGIEIQTEERP